MFKVTIEGETLAELAANISAIALLYSKEASYQSDDAAREKMQAARKGKKPPAEPQPEPEDAALAAELNAPVEPMPDTAKAVVDAGTGKPIEMVAGVPKSEPPLQMTFDDVKLAAGKLAAKDMTKLAALLKKYGAANLSGVPKDKLGDFAADVLEANDA